MDELNNVIKQKRSHTQICVPVKNHNLNAMRNRIHYIIEIWYRYTIIISTLIKFNHIKTFLKILSKNTRLF